MKKSLSLLLAIAMVFSMFATVASAATAEEQAAYSALEEAGIFVGREGGDAALDGELTRAEFASIIARLTGVNSDSPATFDDVPATHWATKVINAVVQAGYMQGTGDNKFEPSRNVTLQEVIAVAVRILGLEVDENATVEGAHPSVQKYIAAALAAGLIQEQADYTAPATRGQLAVVALTVYEQLQGIVKVTGAEAISSKKVVVTFSDGGQVEVELEEALKPGKNTITVTYQDKEYTAEVEYDAPAISAEAVGAKKIAVTFSQPVDDSKVEFEVKKSSIVLNIASKSFNADKTVATLELSSKLTNGDYTVTAKGVEDEDLTATFKAEDERVAKIEFLASNAPLTDLDDDGDIDANDGISIPYQVLNQYGENITKTTTLVTNNAGYVLNYNNGSVDIRGDFRVNDVVAVSLVHPPTATSAVQTFTVAAQARVAEVAITGLYNKDNKSLTEDTNLANDQFYLLVEAKDQYGNPVNNPKKLDADLIVNETNTNVVDVNNANPAHNNGNFVTVEVDGANKTALQLHGAATTNKPSVGSSTITLISNTTGKSASFTVTVVESERADVINLINPGIAVVGEDLYIPVEAFDKNGNPVTNTDALNDPVKGVKLSFNGNPVGTFVKKDGIVQIKIPAANNNTAGINTLIATPASLKIATLQLDIKAAAVPTIIRGFKSDFPKAYLTDAPDKPVTHEDIVIEDQYGRVMNNDQVGAWLKADPDRKIVITDTNAPNNIVAATGDIHWNGTAFTTITLDIANTGKGSEKVTLTLHGDDGNAIAASAVDQTIIVTDGTEFVSYSVDTIGKVYDETAAVPTKIDDSAYDKEVKVYGVLSNGLKVQLSYAGGYYSLSAPSNSRVHNDLVLDGVLNVNAALDYPTDKDEIVVPITVTINRTGETFTQDVTFSKATPKVTALKFVDTATDANAGAKTTYEVSGGTLDLIDLVNGNTAWRLVATDQYGVNAYVDATTYDVAFPDGTDANYIALTFVVKKLNGDINITGNGTSAASVSGIDQYESFEVVVTYGSDAGTASTTITVTHQ